MHGAQEENISLFHKHWIEKANHPEHFLATLENGQLQEFVWNQDKLQGTQPYMEVWRGGALMCAVGFDTSMPFFTQLPIRVSNDVTAFGFEIRVTILCKVYFEYFNAEGCSVRIYGRPVA